MSKILKYKALDRIPVRALVILTPFIPYVIGLFFSTMGYHKFGLFMALLGMVGIVAASIILSKYDIKKFDHDLETKYNDR